MVVADHNFLNWHLAVRSFHYRITLYIVLGMRIGPVKESSVLGSLLMPAPHGRKERRDEVMVVASWKYFDVIPGCRFDLVLTCWT